MEGKRSGAIESHPGTCEGPLEPEAGEAVTLILPILKLAWVTSLAK